MAKKAKVNSTNNKSTPLPILNSVGGVIASYFTVAGIVGSACFFIGHSFRTREYEAQIEDLKFEKMQLQLEFQKQLAEERARLDKSSRSYTIEELKEILLFPIDVVLNEKNTK